MVKRVWWTGREEMLFRQRRLDLEVLGLIAIQWFLIGSFPLTRPRRACLEPGAFITLCAAIGFVFAILPVVDTLAKLPALLVYIAWLVWVILLISLPFRLLWRHFRQGSASKAVVGVVQDGDRGNSGGRPSAAMTFRMCSSSASPSVIPRLRAYCFR